MSSLSSQTFWFLQNNTDIGNATDISIPIATATLSWITISTAGFLAFSTLIGSDAFENYCASGPILWTAGSLYLSPVGSIGVFKSGIKMFWGPDRSKRLGWEPQDILLNKEKLYNFARHATPRYVVNKSESHYRRLYTWRKRKGQSQPTGSDSGSTTLANQISPPQQTQPPESTKIYKLTGGYRVRTRTKEREDDIWMMGGRCLAVNDDTFAAHNRALWWNSIASIGLVIALAAGPASYEIASLAVHGKGIPSLIGIAWAIFGPILHIYLTIISYLRLSLRSLPKMVGEKSDEWYGVSLAEQRKWRYFRTSMNVYGIKDGVLQKRSQDYRRSTRLIGVLLIFYSVLSIGYQAVISARITSERLSYWLRGTMFGYLALGLTARFLVIWVYLRIPERDGKGKMIDHPQIAAGIIYKCLRKEVTEGTGHIDDKFAKVVKQLALWFAATSIYDISHDGTTIRFRLAHAQGERWNISQLREHQISDAAENLASLSLNKSGSFDLTLPRCGYTDSAVSKILFDRNRASIFMFAGQDVGGSGGRLYVCDVPEKAKESSEAQQNRTFRCFFGVLPMVVEAESSQASVNLWVIPGGDRAPNNQTNEAYDKTFELQHINKAHGERLIIHRAGKIDVAAQPSDDNAATQKAVHLDIEVAKGALLTSVCCSKLPNEDRERAQQLERFEGLAHQTVHSIVGTAEAMSGWYDFAELYQIDGPTPESGKNWQAGDSHIDTLNKLSAGWEEYSTHPIFLPSGFL